MVGEPGSLPGQVVVVEDGRPAGQHLGHQVAGRRIEGKGAEVLDHHQVGVGEGGVELGTARRLRLPDGQPGQQPVDRAAPGHGERVEAQTGRAPPATWRPRRPRRRCLRDGRRGRRRVGWRHRSWTRMRRAGSVADRPAPVGGIASSGARRPRARRHARCCRAHLRPAGRAGRGGAHPDHQPAGAAQRHDLGGHRRPCGTTWPGPRSTPRCGWWCSPGAATRPSAPGPTCRAWCRRTQRRCRPTSSPTTTWPGAGWPSCSRRCGTWASPPSPGSRDGPWPVDSGWRWPATWSSPPTGPASAHPSSTWGSGPTW